MSRNLIPNYDLHKELMRALGRNLEQCSYYLSFVDKYDPDRDDDREYYLRKNFEVAMDLYLHYENGMPEENEKERIEYIENFEIRDALQAYEYFKRYGYSDEYYKRKEQEEKEL